MNTKTCTEVIEALNSSQLAIGEHTLFRFVVFRADSSVMGAAGRSREQGHYVVYRIAYNIVCVHLASSSSVVAQPALLCCCVVNKILGSYFPNTHPIPTAGEASLSKHPFRDHLISAPTELSLAGNLALLHINRYNTS